jgi:hypothetical protein
MRETPMPTARMIGDMSVRKFGEATRRDYSRHVKTFSTFLGRSPAAEVSRAPWAGQVVEISRR